MPPWYRTEGSASAGFVSSGGGLPEGATRVINTRTGNYEVLVGDKLYMETPSGLMPKSGGYLAVLSDAEKTIAVNKALAGDELAGRLVPESFGFSVIADNPQSLQMWNDAMRSAASAKSANGYTRYLDALASGQNPSQKILEEAFNAVNSRFVKSSRAAGEKIAEVHHWNFGKTDFPTQIVDPRHLVPVPSREAHQLIHQQTSATSKIWLGPISPLHRIEIPDWSTPLAPKR